MVIPKIKSLIKILLLQVAFLSCAPTKVLPVENLNYKEDPFKEGAVYTEITDSKDLNFYFFHSKEKLLYVSTIKSSSTDSLKNAAIFSIPLEKYGRYEVEGKTVKIQREIEKSVTYTTGDRVFNIMFMFLPVRFNKHKITADIVDKEIITEGEIGDGVIKMYRTYLGSKNYNFKKKAFAAEDEITMNLILDQRLKAKVDKVEMYDRYLIEVIKK